MDLAKLPEYWRGLKTQVLERPRRLAWLWHGLILFLLTGGPSTSAIWTKILESFHVWKWGDSFGALLWSSAWQVKDPVLWAGFCFLAAFGYSLLLHRYLLIDIVPVSRGDARKQFLLEGIEATGLFRVYSADAGAPICLQPYADAMCAALGRASRMRMLSIAGYEYIGRGSGSLLWEGVKKRHDLQIEIIVIDLQAVDGKAVIARRVSALSQKDAAFDEDHLSGQIERTLKTLAKLRAGRGDFSVRLTSEMPPFRMLLLDDDLWLSAYENSAHGHESKLYHFQRKDGASWFPAFEALYEQTSRKSRAI